MIPDGYGDDEGFLFATEIEHDTVADEWYVRVEPESHLAGPAADIDVSTLRTTETRRVETDTGVEYHGRLLFSAGAVVVVNGQVVLIHRDSAAPSDPEKWQSPAGRCEEPPGETGFRELYEELIVLEEGNPVFIEATAADWTQAFEETYEATLQRRGYESPPAEWTRYRGTVPDAARRQLATVILEYGSRRRTSEMLAFFDESNSTLELRHPIAVDVETPSALQFVDGEFDRTIRRFPPAAVAAMDREDLVPTDAHLADTLYPALGH